MAAIGLKRIILLRRIQATDARAHNVTPPHPRSILHAVVKRLALRTLRRTGIPITPSSGPSTALTPPRWSWALLKWMIVSVNSANVARIVIFSSKWKTERRREVQAKYYYDAIEKSCIKRLYVTCEKVHYPCYKHSWYLMHTQSKESYKGSATQYN